MRLVLLVVLLAACGHGECPPGEVCVGMFPGDGGSCQGLQNEFADALLNTGTCISDQDCTVVGGQFGEPTCDCAPFAGECTGIAVARNAPNLSRAQSLFIQMSASCDQNCADEGVDCTCDCAPPDAVICNDSGRCQLVFTNSCLDPPPEPVDAGMFPSDGP